MQAMREDSNLEMDWLWLFTQLTRECERRYALERIIEINPENIMARRILARLNCPGVFAPPVRGAKLCESR